MIQYPSLQRPHGLGGGECLTPNPLAPRAQLVKEVAHKLEGGYQDVPAMGEKGK